MRCSLASERLASIARHYAICPRGATTPIAGRMCRHKLVADMALASMFAVHGGPSWLAPLGRSSKAIRIAIVKAPSGRGHAVLVVDASREDHGTRQQWECAQRLAEMRDDGCQHDYSSLTGGHALVANAAVSSMTGGGSYGERFRPLAQCRESRTRRTSHFPAPDTSSAWLATTVRRALPSSGCGHSDRPSVLA